MLNSPGPPEGDTLRPGASGLRAAPMTFRLPRFFRVADLGRRRSREDWKIAEKGLASTPPMSGAGAGAGWQLHVANCKWESCKVCCSLTPPIRRQFVPRRGLFCGHPRLPLQGWGWSARACSRAMGGSEAALALLVPGRAWGWGVQLPIPPLLTGDVLEGLSWAKLWCWLCPGLTAAPLPRLPSGWLSLDRSIFQLMAQTVGAGVWCEAKTAPKQLPAALPPSRPEGQPLDGRASPRAPW